MDNILHPHTLTCAICGKKVNGGFHYHYKERDNYGFRGFDGRPFKIQLDNGDIYY